MQKKIIKLVMLMIVVTCIYSFLGCSEADSKAKITGVSVPKKYTQERTDSQGSVEIIEYEVSDATDNSGKTEIKKASVYLPYGYDVANEYDVIYLLHGTDNQSIDHKSTWLYSIGAKNILDNMISYGECKPMIVVTPTFYSYGLYGDDTIGSNIKELTPVKQKSMANFASELRNSLIPAVESKYSTYAQTTALADLIKSREHRAMAGLSAGGRLTLDSGLASSLDIISTFGCYSAAVDADSISEAIDSEKFRDYEIKYFFNADGIYDFAFNQHKKMYNKLLGSDKITDKNSSYVEIAFGYHSNRSWQISFYDSLQLFFK